MGVPDFQSRTNTIIPFVFSVADYAKGIYPF